MLSEMLCRLPRVVIVRCAMLIMVMAHPVDMFNFVGDVKHFLKPKRAALRSETVQGKQEHQENAEKATHGEVVKRVGQ